MGKTEAKPAAVCTHRRYTVDVQEQTGRCIDCGAEGRMQFVVGDPVAAERERLCEALKIEMQHSAWDGVLQLDDALRNIDDLKA
jgi:hypothetical protein